MRIRKEIGLNGKEITFYTPENDADLETLGKMKNLSDKASFGDWKKNPKLTVKVK